MQDLKLAVWQYLVGHTRSTIQVAYRDFSLPFSWWLLMLTTSKGIFFSSSHTFGCHLEVLGSGRIAFNNIWIPFPFLTSVSFSCILESTYDINPCFLRSYVGSHSVQRYQHLLIDNRFQPVWYQALHCCNRFYFGGRRGKQRSSSTFSVVLLSSSFCRVAGAPCLTFKLCVFSWQYQ